MLGHPAGAAPEAGWEAHRIDGDAGGAEDKTEDGEACTRRGRTLYVLGSQFGSKSGPLEASRHFAARLDEGEVLAALEGDTVRLEVARLRFSLHRAVNDLLAQAGPPLIELGPVTRERYIDATIRHGASKEKRWNGRVISADHPINLEGAAFRENGSLLLGLRYPVTAEGHPLLVEVPEVDALFEEPETPPPLVNVWILGTCGEPGRPVGIRALHHAGRDVFDVVVGNLDSKDKDSGILADHPEGGDAHSEHHRFSLPLEAAGGVVRTELAHEFPGLTRVEGIAVGDEGRVHVVIDEDGRVHLRTLLIA